MLFMAGVALQFHFGQYVEFLGHGVDTLGHVLSIGMVGGLAIRLHVGRWIDRFGCRPTWLAGTVVVALAVGSIQFTERIWLITVLRVLSQMATAAVMTTVAVFAAQTAPPQRRAESIGIMGLAGFLGIVIGPTLGDWIFSGSTDSIIPYRIFFSMSAVFSLLATGVIVLTQLPPTAPPVPTAQFQGWDPAAARPSQIRVIVTHWPGAVLLVGLVFAMVFCLQSSFLERLAEARGFKDIKVFFLVYASTAITLRIIGRRVPERIGRTRAVLGGLLLLSTGLLCLTGIRSQGQLVLPAFLMGAGHCFIFPSMVDLAAERLPFQHRGTGTALIMAAGDLGMLIGFVGLGELIDSMGYDTALAALAGIVLLGAVIFSLARREALFMRTFGVRHR